MKGFEAFIAKHRFQLSDLCGGREFSTNEYEISRLFFPVYDMFIISTRRSEYEKFRYAIAVASYVSQYMTEYPDQFSKCISFLDEESWNFVLKFCPFHEIFSLFENLNLTIKAIDEAVISMHGLTASAGASVLQGGSQKFDESIRESIKINLFKFATLYGLYIDLCQRVVALAKMRNSDALRRARSRILGKNLNVHVFSKDLRNFLVHYQMVNVSISVRIMPEKRTYLFVNSHDLLWCGFDWKAESSKFLQINDQLDVLSMIEAVRLDIKRVVDFYRKAIYIRMSKEKHAYFYYRNEWNRFKLRSAMLTDLSSVLGKKTTFLSRVVDEYFLSDILSSSLSDEDVKYTLLKIINKNDVFSARFIAKIDSEISDLLNSRPRYPVGGHYFKGRPVEDV